MVTWCSVPDCTLPATGELCEAHERESEPVLVLAGAASDRE